MGWLTRIIPGVRGKNKQGIPDGVWQQCKGCQAPIYLPDMINNLWVCPKCGHHAGIRARVRLLNFLDEDSAVFFAEDIVSEDILGFTDLKPYTTRIKNANSTIEETAALLVAKGFLKGQPVVAAAFEFNYIGGSMDRAVGERFRLAVESAIEQRCPFICFSASGGARMQEGVYSLLQMSKTAAVLKQLAEHHLPYISILCHPTTGGVAASLSMLGDVIIAEPGALIGFTGPRVIEQTVKQKLPKGFQRSEFLFKQGHIDKIVHRHQLADMISNILKKLLPNDA